LYGTDIFSIRLDFCVRIFAGMTILNAFTPLKTEKFLIKLKKYRQLFTIMRPVNGLIFGIL